MQTQQAPRMTQPHRQKSIRARQAFTLIELLVVVIIIGILMSLVTAGVMTARRRIVDSALKVELTNIELAIEAYRDKYGDYPPDFSDWGVVQRHFRTAFPKISARDLGLLAQACFVDPADSSTFQFNGIDRAEALVFALGGFSSDARFPFSGSGGPFVGISGATDADDLASYHYNTSRDNRIFEFDETRLTMAITSAALGYSTDEGSYWNTSSAALAATVAPTAASAPTGVVADLFPVYRRKNDEASLPIVYFDSRSYSSGTTTRIVNNYQPTGVSVGVAKPYKSLLVNTGTASTVPDDGLFFVNQNGFQIISGGQDEHYGGNTGAASLAYIFPSGAGFNLNTGLVAGVGNYLYDADPANFQEDNVTNFSSTTLESDLE